MKKLNLIEKRICLVQGRLFEETASRGMDSLDFVEKDISSEEIYKIADFETMCTAYLGFHTLSPEMAIDRLIESHESYQHKL